MQIESYEELLATHRALMEIHFVEEVFSAELIGSPYRANIANRVLDALIELDVKKKGPQARTDWQAWRNLTPDQSNVWQILERRVKSPGLRRLWERTELEHRARYVRDMVSPYTLTDENLALLLNEL